MLRCKKISQYEKLNFIIQNINNNILISIE